MNTKQIEYILTLAEVGNFNRAAEQLFISQPTLTYQVKSVEQEIGFKLFHRTGTGVTLTTAGEQLCITLRNIREALHRAIEQGRNLNERYKHTLVIGLPFRSCLPRLPEVINDFESKHDDLFIMPRFLPLSDNTAFLNGEVDVLFAMNHDVAHIPDCTVTPFKDSRLYVVTRPDDEVAQYDLINAMMLAGRRLMVGGGSPPALRNVQEQLIATGTIDYFTSADHDTTLTNVMAKKGIVIAPGFLHDPSDNLVWMPYDTNVVIQTVLCTHKSVDNPLLADLVKTLCRLHEDIAQY